MQSLNLNTADLKKSGYLSKAFKIILLAWFIAGTLDISAAFIDYYMHTGRGPDGVLRYIASGIFGKAAFTANQAMMWFGLLIHYLVAFLFTIFFYWLYPHIKLLQKNIFLTAVLYGIFVWFIMNFIVVPLSNTPEFPFNIINSLKALVILICMIGLPLSIIMRRIYFNRNRG